MRSLVLDIGNSSIKAGVFYNQELIRTEKSRSNPIAFLSKIIEDYNIEYAILSSTAVCKQDMIEFLKEKTQFFELSHEMKFDFDIKYTTPHTLGRDRIAAVAGARYLYPNGNLLVIDAGTCITFDIVDVHNNYLGGSIHPGISMRFKALNTFTGKLPLIRRNEDYSLIGNSTEQAILAGVQMGVVKEMDGMIDAYISQFDELKVIITGGDISFFVNRLKNQIFALPNLVLVGLNKILTDNAI